MFLPSTPQEKDLRSLEDYRAWRSSTLGSVSQVGANLGLGGGGKGVITINSNEKLHVCGEGSVAGSSVSREGGSWGRHYVGAGWMWVCHVSQAGGRAAHGCSYLMRHRLLRPTCCPPPPSAPQFHLPESMASGAATLKR